MNTIPRGYDAWLERPYQERYAQDMPSVAEHWMDAEFWLDGEKVKVVSFECWEDADEDGKYGGVDLVVRNLEGTPHERNMSAAEIEEAIEKQAEHRGEE